MIGVLTGIPLDVGAVPQTLLQFGGSSSLVVIVTGIIGAVAVLLRAASTHFDPSADEDEETEVEIATGDTHGHGGAGGHHSSFKETVTAELTEDPGAGDIKVSRGPVSRNRRRTQKIGSVHRQTATQCSHCGAVNKGSGSLCWNCGSNPDATLTENDLSTVNDRLREMAVDDSYVVRKGEDPRPYPVETTATPREERDQFEESAGTTEEDIRKEDRPPIWRVWAGSFIGWVRKWQMLINTHTQSMVLVALIAAVVWGCSLVYGAARFGVSGFVALLGASLLAVLSAAIAVLFFLVPGKRKTIGLAYPFALNVIFLPPLIIAYYEPVLSFIWDYSLVTAGWILDTFLHYYDINAYLRRNYTLTNQFAIAMWFGISYPLGWTLGSSVHIVKSYGPSLLRFLSQLLTRRSQTPDE